MPTVGGLSDFETEHRIIPKGVAEVAQAIKKQSNVKTLGAALFARGIPLGGANLTRQQPTQPSTLHQRQINPEPVQTRSATDTQPDLPLIGEAEVTGNTTTESKKLIHPTANRAQGPANRRAPTRHSREITNKTTTTIAQKAIPSTTASPENLPEVRAGVQSSPPQIQEASALSSASSVISTVAENNGITTHTGAAESPPASDNDTHKPAIDTQPTTQETSTPSTTLSVISTAVENNGITTHTGAAESPPASDNHAHSPSIDTQPTTQETSTQSTTLSVISTAVENNGITTNTGAAESPLASDNDTHSPAIDAQPTTQETSTPSTILSVISTVVEYNGITTIADPSTLPPSSDSHTQKPAEEVLTQTHVTTTLQVVPSTTGTTTGNDVSTTLPTTDNNSLEAVEGTLIPSQEASAQSAVPSTVNTPTEVDASASSASSSVETEDTDNSATRSLTPPHAEENTSQLSATSKAEPNWCVKFLNFLLWICTCSLCGGTNKDDSPQN